MNVDLPARVTVLFGTWFDGWAMVPYQGDMERPWINGGVRALIELAAALASLGVEVDLRGHFLESEVSRIEGVTGTRLGRPLDRRMPTAEDVVIVPEGHRDPMLLARAAFSPARAVLFVQAALGLFGWSFDGGPTPSEEELLTFDTTTVGRPEQLRAAREFGFELWTNAHGIAEQGRRAQVPVHDIGSGRPSAYPEPQAKQIDVLALGDNRWTPLARQVLAELPSGIGALELPRVPHAEILAAFSLSRVFIHPSRIEGRSRLVEEARAMRAVPVVLASNTLGEGYGEQYGSVVVESVADMAPAVTELLGDPARLERLADNGYRHAREIGDMDAYRSRVRDALLTPDLDVARRAAARAQLGDAFHAWTQGFAAQLSAAQNQLMASAEALRREREALDAERATFDAAAARLIQPRVA